MSQKVTRRSFFRKMSGAAVLVPVAAALPLAKLEVAAKPSRRTPRYETMTMSAAIADFDTAFIR